MKKKHVITAVLAVLVLAAVLGLSGHQNRDQKREKRTLRIGVTLYRGDDSFINYLSGNIEEKAKEYEQETGIKVVLDVVDGKGDQYTQNSQVDRFISLGMDAICVNIVDRSASSYIISKAMAADIPVVFFNREPVEEDMNRWEKLYYVGESAKESAYLQGNILVEAYQKDPSILDLNGDGKVSYVLLEGETGHQDSLIRTEWSIQTLKDGGVPLEKITGGIANWERSQGAAWMEQWLKEYPDEIELVISNNDDMGLGAADALEQLGIKRPVKIVGIDGTPQGMKGLRSGKLFGTVRCDSGEYANTILRLAAACGLGQSVPGVGKTEQKRYYINQEAMTQKRARAMPDSEAGDLH